MGEYIRALETFRELVALSSPPSEAIMDGAIRNALLIAEHTDDAAIRDRYIGEGLALIEQLPEPSRTRWFASIAGSFHLLAGRAADAIPDLSKALAASEVQEPRIPYHMMTRSFALAQALWETGGTRDRERAKALAEQAERYVPAAR